MPSHKMLEDTKSLLGNSGLKENYSVSPYRFVIAFVFTIASNQNTLCWGIFSPLLTILQNGYHESLSYVTFATVTISSIVYIPAGFIGNYIIDTYGLKVGTIVGSVLTLMGLWLRCLSLDGFGWIFVGQIFAGFAQPYFFSTPQKFSNVWFPPRERSYATTFLSCVGIIGNAVGPLISGWFMDVNSTDYEALKVPIQRMCYYLALFGSICFVITIVLIRAKPAVPPSEAAKAVKYDYAKSLKYLLLDRNVMIMIIATSILNGNVINYMAAIQPMTAPWGFSPSAIGKIMSLSNFTGLIGSFLGAFIIHMTKKYNLVLISSSVLSLFALVANLFAAKTGNPILFGAVVTIYVIALNPILPISLEYGVELSFPIAEATSAGIWFVINSLVSFLETLGIDSLLGNNPTASQGEMSFYIMIGLQVIMIIPLFFVKEDLKRKKYEESQHSSLMDPLSEHI